MQYIWSASREGGKPCDLRADDAWLPRWLQVIKANDDLTPEHHQFFLYQMLRGLKYIHTGEPCTAVKPPVP